MDVATRPVHPWVTAGDDRIRCGAFSPIFPDHRRMRSEVGQLENLGYDAVFLPDHPFALMGDPWLTLAGCVDATTHLRLGVMVSCVAYRHPGMLARAAADVDRMSNGRVVLGLGSGDMPHEFAMLGLDWGTPRTRRTRLQQALQVVPALLRGERVSFEGDEFALREAALPMPAVQQPHIPLVVAGGSRGALRLAAEHADAANIGAASFAGGVYNDDDIADRFAALDEFCSARGRAPASVLRTAFVGVSIAPTSAEARSRLDQIPPEAREMFRGFFFAGDPQETVTHLQHLVDTGYRYLVFFTTDAFVFRSEMIQLLATDVVPRVLTTQPA
jgi:alkanesulfonate monooxygenase SsuD/methylene tetrahydromethanopterin reductase-like flavin-dependent oxidoreductase (luciferase family)